MTETAHETRTRSQSGHSDTVTEGVRVIVGAQYHEEQSRPEVGRWFFSYRVILRNEGTAKVRLLTRHWQIRDGDNLLREVDGPGVVGEHPELEPGESFEYMSALPAGDAVGHDGGLVPDAARRTARSSSVRIGRFFLAPTTAPLSALQA